MKAGDVILKTQIDNSELEKDLDELVDEIEEKGEEAGEGFGDEVAEGTEKKSSAVNSAIARIFSKVTGLGVGLTKTITSLISAIAGAGVGLGAIVGIIGLIVGAVYILAKAFQKVFSENEEIIADIKYLVWVIGQALQPAVDFVANIFAGILKIIIKIIGYAIALLNLLTGGKLFGDTGADKYAESMKEAEDSTGGIANNLKDAKKQLAGFDEMNVLSDNQSGGGGAGIGAEIPEITMPDFQISDFEKKIQEVLNKWYEFGNGLQTYLEETNFEEEFGNWGLAVEGVIEIILGLWEIITGFGEMATGLIKMIVGLITLDMEQVKEGFDLFIQGIVHLIDGVYKFMDGIVDLIVGIILGAINTVRDWFSIGVTWILNNVIKPIADFFVGLWNGIVDGGKGAWEGIKYWFGKALDFLISMFSTIWNKAIEFGFNIGESIAGAFKGVVNAILSSVEWILNKPINAINGLIDTINAIPGINLGKLKTFSLPRLARGGIVNNPGPGVMMGSYIAGERGPEAVLPLTDDTLQRLANMIPITVNLTNTMNGKVISREIQRIQNQEDFAFNR